MRTASELLAAGEKELFETQHFQPKKCEYNQCQLKFHFNSWFTVANSPGGCAYAREVIPPDWVLDYWHPLEKAAYPEYFARREKRKEEFVSWWEKTYGKPDAKDLGHHQVNYQNECLFK